MVHWASSFLAQTRTVFHPHQAQKVARPSKRPGPASCTIGKGRAQDHADCPFPPSRMLHACPGLALQSPAWRTPHARTDHGYPLQASLHQSPMPNLFTHLPVASAHHVHVCVKLASNWPSPVITCTQSVHLLLQARRRPVLRPHANSSWTPICTSLHPSSRPRTCPTPNILILSSLLHPCHAKFCPASACFLACSHVPAPLQPPMHA